jgi:hypothetical protein
MADQFIPDNQFVPDQAVAQSDPVPASVDAQQPGNAPSFIPDNQFQSDEETYGTLPQQALTAVEGGAQGYVGPVATAAERALTEAGVPGLTPQEQEARAQVNPWTHGLSEVAGLGAGFATGTGEARALEEIGSLGLKAAAKPLAGLAEKTALGSKLAGSALRGAIETTLYTAGDDTSKIINNPSLSVSTAMANLPLSALIGAGGGAILGPLSPFWEKESGDAVAQGITDFNNTLDGTVTDQAAAKPIQDIVQSGLEGFVGKQKSNAAEIADIAERNQWPLAEGMTSDNKLVQKAEDALLNGPPTIPSIARQKLYQQGYDAAATSVDRTIGSGATEMSETEAGNALKASLTQKLEAENEPIKELYKAVEPFQEQIPVNENEAGTISEQMQDLIKSKNLVPGTERYNFVKTFADNAGAIENLAQLKNFRTEIGRSAGPLTKDLAGDINSMLGGVEEDSIGAYAGKNLQGENMYQGLLQNLKNAKGQYKDFITKLQTLGASMGKKRVYGPQDFIDFVDNLNPQTLTKRLFNEKNTEFTQYFAKNFPDEMAIMRGYQRGLIKQEASKLGAFSAPKAIKEVLDMEPEMQKLLFSDGEVQTIKDADTYLRSFPKNFNPSGTAHESAFREFFEHPAGALIANIRDYGIQSFIKAFGKAAPGAETEAGKIIPILGKAVQQKEVNPGAFKHAVEYTMAVIRGENAIGRAAKSAFHAAIPVAATVVPEQDKLDKLDARLKKFQANPDLNSSIGGEVGHYLPNHDIALKGMTSNAVAYLNAQRPNPVKLSPLDPEIKPSPMQMANYHNALSIAEKPLSVISDMKDGTLTTQKVNHLNILYPGLKDQLAQKLTDEMTNQIAKGNSIPYNLRFGLSTLMGQPMDSSMSPQSVMANQAAYGVAAQQAAQKTKGRSSTSQVGMRETKRDDRISLDMTSDEG